MPVTGAVEPGYQFASDNTSGICPEAWEALERANRGYSAPYGDDEWTARAADLVRELFETDCEIFFTYNGTAANSLALSSMCHSYHSVICSELAHIETDECGGPEFFSNGLKLLLAPSADGTIDPADVQHIVGRRSDIHYPKPRVLSVTQATELGTTYSASQLGALFEAAERCGLRVHMDGARLGNSLAHLDLPPKALTWQLGVDVLCLGGAKNGLAAGEIVVFFDRRMADEFDYRCKQAGQLASKMRFLAAPWVGVLESGAWLRNAQHANRCARELEQQLRQIPGVTVLYPCQANSVFLSMPPSWLEALRREGWRFYTFIGRNAARLTCSWQTTAAELHALVQSVRRIAGRPAAAHV